MSNENFKVKYGLEVGDSATTIDATTGDIVTTGDVDVQGGDITNSTGAITITTSNDGDFTVTPDGTGQVVVNSNVDINGTISTDDLQVDNININGNTISSTDTDGDITLDPDGTGRTIITGDLEVTGQVLTNTSSVTTSIQITDNTISSTENGIDIVITPATGGLLQVSSDIQTTETIVAGDADLGNIRIAGNTISSFNVDGNITLDPDGTGQVIIDSASDVTGSLSANRISSDNSLFTGNNPSTSNYAYLAGSVSSTGVLTTGSINVNGLNVGNHDSNTQAGILMRSFGQNNPGGTTSTAPLSAITLEGSRGTPGSPLAMNSNTILGLINFGGYDGANWSSETGTAPIQLIALATNPWTNDGTYITNNGAWIFLRANPRDIRQTSTSRQNLWSFNFESQGSGNPPQVTANWNQASYVALTDNSGNPITGHGKMLEQRYHSLVFYKGVPAEDASPQNSTLPGTNGIRFYSSRQSEWTGKKSPLQSGDTILYLEGYGQTNGPNGSGDGEQNAKLRFYATENHSSGNQGSGFQIQVTPNGSGGNAGRYTALQIASDVATISSDELNFKDSAGVELKSGKLTYRRTHGCFHKVAQVTAAASNTVYNFDWTNNTTTHHNTGVTISNTSHIDFDDTGAYNIQVQFQARNSANSLVETWVWLAKNGTDITETGTMLSLRPKGSSTYSYQQLNTEWLIDVAAGDYIEVRFAVSDHTAASIEYTAANTLGFTHPSIPAAVLTVQPMGA